MKTDESPMTELEKRELFDLIKKKVKRLNGRDVTDTEISQAMSLFVAREQEEDSDSLLEDVLLPPLEADS